jgi:hypothetical protein
MFELTASEYISLRYHFGTIKNQNENVTIIRAFVKVREIIYSNKDLVRKISELEKLTNEKFKNQDKIIGLVFEAIKEDCK